MCTNIKTKDKNTKIPVTDRIKIAQRENKWLVLVDNRCYAIGISKENAFNIAHKLSAIDQ